MDWNMDLVSINEFLLKKINQAPYPIIYQALPFQSTLCLWASPLIIFGYITYR